MSQPRPSFFPAPVTSGWAFVTAKLLAAALAALTTACAAPHQPFDSAQHLREIYAERTRRAAPGEILVPFELDDLIRQDIESRFKPALREEFRLEQVTDFIFRKVGLQYSLTPTRNAVEVYHAREGNCLSFVNLFVGVARHNRLNPFYVEVTDHQRWRHSNGMVLSQGHIVAGLYINGELRTVDFLPYTPKSYKDFNPIDDLTAAAHHYNNLAAETLLADGDAELAQHYLALATELVPTFEKALNNLGVVRARLGDVDGALEAYEKGLAGDPKNVPILTNMARLYQQRGDVERAAEVLARVEGAQTTNPFYFVYRGELALTRGEAAEALGFMRQALRLDTEIPEVHVGLAKVYLALGDLERVDHHLGRALRLDATHQEARELATIVANRPR
jgi:tetratricopeptide (TPR) repeat protein